MKKKPQFRRYTTQRLYLKSAKKEDIKSMPYHVIRYMISFVLIMIMLMSMIGCSRVEEKVEEKVEVKVTVTEAQRFDEFLEKMARNALMASPLTATFTLGDLKREGLEALASQLDHLSLDTIKQTLEQNAINLATLESMDYSQLSHGQQLNYELAKYNMTTGAKLYDHLYIQNLIQASSGIQVDFPLALMQIEFDSKEEIDAFILRVKEFPRLIDEVIVYEKERFSLGYGLPGYIYSDVVQQITDMLVEPENFLMMQSFSERIDQFPTLTDEEKSSYKHIYLDIVINQLYPAFEKIKEQAQSMEQSTASGSISDWPEGKAYYEDLIVYMTSEELDVEGLKEWATNEINVIAEQFQILIKNDPQILEVDFEAALPSYNSMEDIYSAINLVYKEQFNDYGVTFATENVIPTYLEDTLAAGFYFPITVDGEDYGNMYLQEKDYKEPVADTLMLYYHENIPGHHLYYSYIAKSSEPLYRKMNEYLAYEEGWATYCQNLSFENMGLSDGIRQFFILNAAYSNAFMVLMDIRLHYEGVPTKQIKEEFLSLGYDEESVDAMVNRMISKPGETVHYMYGNHKMHQWKSQYQEAKGDSFDIKEFHDFVLMHFGLPFYVVEKELDRLAP
jgi:uncharacterized protein (DUF885 family)